MVLCSMLFPALYSQEEPNSTLGLGSRETQCHRELRFGVDWLGKFWPEKGNSRETSREGEFPPRQEKEKSLVGSTGLKYRHVPSLSL